MDLSREKNSDMLSEGSRTVKKLLAAIVLFGVFAFVEAGAGQAAVTTHTTIPSSFGFFDVCSNEPVFVSGNVDILITSTVTDNTISGTVHTLFKATGIGLVSGQPYQEEVAFVREFHSSPQNGQFEVTQFGEINVVTPGGGNNLWSPILMHLTFDANGNLTSSTFNPFPEPTCH